MTAEDRIDARDLAIIKILRENARTSLRKIGERVKLGASSVRKRINRLHEIGVIKRFTIEVDYRRIGYEIHVLVMIRAKPGSSESLYQTLSSYEEVSEIFWTAGPANFVCIVRVKNMTELSKFMSASIESLDSVEKVDTIFLMPRPEGIASK
ncbi:MAG: Lrp/AsnC family transcriptional regulator [Candidatus Thorarchaeota archaeon]|nr:Lrp/AsnC family transcriptional regulator [Candidatus Thorarchaeota archaeon]